MSYQIWLIDITVFWFMGISSFIVEPNGFWILDYDDLHTNIT